MKNALLALAVLSLLGCLWPAYSYFAGNITRDVLLAQFSFASLGWFVCASWWAYKK